MKQLFQTGVYLVVLVLLSSCGGGGSNGGDVTPNAPSNVVATLVDGAIRITWAHDDRNVIGFAVYRNEGAPLGNDAQDAEKIADTPASVKLYDDNAALDPTKQYSYSVSAKGTQGESARVAIEEPIQPAPTAGNVRVRTLFGGEGGKGVIKSSDGAINCTEPGGANCSSDFKTGSTLTLEATPNPGSEFVGWQGVSCAGTGPCAVAVNAENDPDGDNIIEVTALFNQTGYVLTVDKQGSGSGTVVSTPSGINCGDDCQESYVFPVQNNPAIKVGFSAVTAESGSLFNGWGGACPSATATSSCVVSMDADKTVVAFFSKPAPDSYSVGEGETLTQDAPGVLANDVALAGGVTLDTDPVQDPENGTLTLEADGSFSYRHNGSNTTTDSFVYRVSDKRGNEAEVTVSLSINAGNDPPVAEDDVYATAEDTTRNVPAADGVLKNDSDDEGDALSAELRTDVTNGTLTLKADGSFIYTPDTNFSGTDTFTYVAKAGGQESAPATVTITVSNSNDAPVASGGTATVLEDGTVSITLNATDSDSPSLTYEIVTPPANGTLSGGTGKTRTYTPNADFNGTDSFTFKANDGSTDSNTATVTVTVTPVNDAPSFALSQTTVTGSPVSNFATTITKGPANETAQDLEFIVTRTDTDGGLEFSAGPAISAAGTLSYTVQAGSAGSATFSVLLKDSGGVANGGVDTSSAKAFTITAEAEEKVISVSVTPASATIEEGNTRQLTANVRTEGGAATTVTWKSSNEAVASVNSSGLVTAVSPSATPVTITATSTVDPTKSDTATITVTPEANTPPNGVIDTPVAARTITVGQSVNFTGTGTDPDAGQKLTYLWNFDGGAANSTEQDPGPVIFNTADTYNVTFTVTDSEGLSDPSPATVQITVNEAVNEPPVATNGTATVLEDSSTPITLNATDSDSATLTYAIVTQPGNGTLSGGTGKTRTYTPNNDFNGTDTFSFKANDGNSDSNTATVTVTVTAVNDPPSFALSQTAVTGSPGPQTVPNFATTITKGPANEASQTLNFTVTRTDTDGGLEFSAGPAISPAGALSYTVQAGSAGSATFSVLLKDSGGVANGGVDTSSARSFTISAAAPDAVTSVEVEPDDPEVDTGDTQKLKVNVETRGDAPKTVQWKSTNEAVATVNQEGVVQGLAPGKADISATSTFDASKVDTVSVTVNGVTSVTVSPNPVPTLTVGQAQTLTANVEVFGNADTKVEWTSSNSDVVSVDKSDGRIEAEAAGEVVITVTSTFDRSKSASVNVKVEDAVPIPENDAYTTPEDETLFATSANGVLANDGAEQGSVSAVLASPASNGSVSLAADGSFEYVPNPDFFGEDNFSYRLQRGQDVSEPASVGLRITAVNDPPTSLNVQDPTFRTDDRGFTLDLYEVFDDIEDDDSDLEFSVVASNPSIFSNAFIREGRLTIFLSGTAGNSDLTITATDTEGASANTRFNVSVVD